MQGQWSSKRAAGVMALYFAGYVAAQALTSAMHTSPIHIAPIWVPLGYIVAVFFATEPSRWLMLTIAGVLGQLATSWFVGASWETLGLISINAHVAGALVAMLIRKTSGSGHGLTLRRLAAVCAGLLLMEVILVPPVTWLLVTLHEVSEFASTLRQNAMNGALSLLIVSPVVSAIISEWGKLRQTTTSRRRFECLLQWGLVVLASWISFWLNNGQGYGEPLIMLPLPALLWAAMRFDVAVSAFDLMTVTALAFAAARRGMGPFRSEPEDLRTSMLQLHMLALCVPVLFLAAVAAEQRRAERRVEAQLRYEKLVAGISSMLVGARPENIDELLTEALAKIATVLGSDRVIFGETDMESGELVARATYRNSDPPYPERLVISQRYPYMWGVLGSGNCFIAQDTSKLVPEAAIDRKHFQEVGIQSQIGLPVIVDRKLRFVLTAASQHGPSHWQADAIGRMQVLAETLSSALMRCSAEKQVEASERLFRSFVENAPVPIMLAPGPDGATLYFNPAFTEVFGYEKHDLARPTDWWPLAYADAEHRRAREAAWENLKRRALETGNYMDGEETEMRRKDGSTIFAQVRLKWIDGHRLVYFNDLTARRRAEAALRLTQYTVDHNPVMIYRLNAAGEFVYVNDAACRVLGYAPAELQRKKIWDIAVTLSADKWPQRIALLREQGGAHVETVFVRKNGETFPVEVRIHYLEYGEAAYVFAFAMDITERRAAERATQRHMERVQALATELMRAEERQRRELAAVLHDEVGQNLFAATTQLLAARNVSGQAQSSVDKALSLLDEITRDARELTFQLCPPVLYELGLKPALQRLTDQFTSRYQVPCRLTGLTLGPHDLNARGMAYHAVRELLNNVAKHARAKSVLVNLSETDERLKIVVGDDGRGFDAGSLAPGKGGVGLYHLRERIELLGGRLAITSTPGAGCRAELDLPLGPLVVE
jgi:PAS domain S-box-containing protein